MTHLCCRFAFFFLIFRGYRGFCHRTESDIFLFSLFPRVFGEPNDPVYDFTDKEARNCCEKCYVTCVLFEKNYIMALCNYIKGISCDKCLKHANDVMFCARHPKFWKYNVNVMLSTQSINTFYRPVNIWS